MFDCNEIGWVEGGMGSECVRWPAAAQVSMAQWAAIRRELEEGILGESGALWD